MNQPVPVSSSSTSLFTSNSMRSLDVSSRYMGMIELSAYKKTRNNFFQLFDYVTTTSPPFFSLHAIMSVLRILQFFGPTFCARYYDLWGKGNVMNSVNDVLSILFHIVPASLMDEAAVYIMYIYSILFVLIFCFLQGSSYYYSKEAKLPPAIPPLISLYFGTIGYYFPPIAVTAATGTIGRMIMDPDTYVNTLNIVGIVLVAITTATFIWLYSAVYSVSITFRPDSLQVIIPSVQTNIICITMLIYGLTGVATEVSLIPRCILTGLAAVSYILMIVAINQYGGFVSLTHKKAFLASAISGCLLLVIEIIFENLGIKGSEAILILIAAVWAVCFIGCNCFLERSTNTSLALLDIIEEDPDNIHLIKNTSTYCNVVIDGFRYAHPICLSWTMFKAGIEKWPKDVKIWLSFSKFTAIYPEETQQLDWISVSIIQNKLKGSLAKHTLQQIQTIIRQRETNLVPELKSKLDKVGKQVQATKHKVRYIWDLIIQGNVHELESVVHRAYTAIENCEAEFQHLLRMFPNSRFVARAYSRFLRDVVADYAAHNQWQQNVTLLQRGVSVISDQTHDLGIRAFPLLPKTIENSGNGQVPQGLITDDTLTQEIEVDEEQAALDAELKMSVRESINNLVIPSYKTARITRIILIFVLFIATTIALAIAIPIFISSITTPLSFMEKVSTIRTETFQLVGLTHHMILESFPSAKFIKLQLYGDDPPQHFGGTDVTRDQVEYVLKGLNDNINGLSEIMSFKPDDTDMELVRDYLFRNAVNFTTYKDEASSEPTYEMISAQNAISQYIVLVQNLLKQDSYEPEILSKKEIKTMFANIQSLTNDLSNSLEHLKDYIISADKEIEIMMKWILIVACIVVFFANLIATIVIVIHISREKLTIYKCIASLPKNIVSRVADTFKVLKKEEDDETKTSHTRDEELNKQEENMLKIFSTSSDSSGGTASDAIAIITCTIVITALNIGTFVLLCMFMLNAGKSMTSSAPHIDYIMASYSYDFASVIILNMIASHFDGNDIPGYDIDKLLSIIVQWQNKGITNYQAVRFGNSDMNAEPFSVLSEDMLKGKTDADCADGIHPTSTHDVYRCWNPDLLTSYVQTEVGSLIFKYQQDDTQTFSGDDAHLTHLWHIHLIHLFENYYYELFSQIVPTVTSSLEDGIPAYTGAAFGLLAAGIIFEIAILVILSNSEARQKFALRLLLHCPGNVVISNSHITQLLAGNFTEKQIDSTTRDAEFYDVLVKDMPDAVLTLDLTGKILTANNATTRIFGLKEEDLIGHTIEEFGSNFKEPNPFLVCQKKPLTPEDDFEACHVYNKPGGAEIYTDVTFTVLNENLLVTMRDDTQTVMYNRLIADEKAKSDKLLASILPARLVSRVQAGEKNISFAVQSVTVVFMDIVSFTPWCGSLPASTVMSTLNLLFKENDQLVAMHPTMTKIKCIGDCYMAAGGIFADVNQPQVHAKDVVEFGLEAIEALERVNKQIDQNLRIRVGINTGGPIVAGVLGTEKPTFEILGPAINMAQQMEHHGVPMKVHVSRAVYELIYGGNFDVKERGEIEVKNGKVLTYLIESKK